MSSLIDPRYVLYAILRICVNISCITLPEFIQYVLKIWLLTVKRGHRILCVIIQ